MNCLCNLVCLSRVLDVPALTPVTTSDRCYVPPCLLIP